MNAIFVAEIAILALAVLIIPSMVKRDDVLSGRFFDRSDREL